MTIYYVDPYIESGVGGITGTTDTTTGDGSWAAPFKMSHFRSSSINGLTTVNGITVLTGDEFRFKGLADLDAFTSSVVKVNGFSHYAKTVRSADESNFQTWLTDVNTAMGNDDRGFFCIDPILHPEYSSLATAASGPEGMIMLQADYCATPNTIRTYSGSSTMSNGPYKRYTESSGDRLNLRLFDPQYYIPSNFNTSHNYFQFTKGVTLSAGWTSTSSNNGITILNIFSTNTSNSYTHYIFPTNTSTAIVTADLSNFHFMFGSKSYNRPGKISFSFERFTGSYNHEIGTLSSNCTDAWCYLRMSNAAHSAVQVEVGSLGLFYGYYYGDGQSGKGNTIKIYCWYGGNVLWRFSSNDSADCRHELGHLMFSASYSSSLFYCSASSTTTKFYIMDGAYLQAGSPNSTFIKNFNTSGEFVFLGSAYNWATTPWHTASLSSNSLGPDAPYSWVPTNGALFKEETTLVKMNPTGFTDTYLLKHFNTSAVISIINSGYPQEMNTTYGTLDTGGDYRTKDFKQLNYEHFGPNTAYDFRGQNITFASNNYDGAPIRLIQNVNTSRDSAEIPLIAYNDINNNDYLTVQGNSATETSTSLQYFRHYLLFELPSGYIAGTNQVKVTISGSRSSTFTQNITAWWKYATDQGSGYASLGNTATWTGDNFEIILTSSLTPGEITYVLDTFDYMGVTLTFNNPGLASRKFWITDLTVELV